MMEKKWVTVLGSFVADLAFRTGRIPVWGETLLGNEFKLGPGGKGSNQAVAAARAGGRVSFISKLGPDPFGDMARHRAPPARPPSSSTLTRARTPSSSCPALVLK
jgi:ribokinase